MSEQYFFVRKLGLGKEVVLVSFCYVALHFLWGLRTKCDKERKAIAHSYIPSRHNYRYSFWVIAWRAITTTSLGDVEWSRCIRLSSHKIPLSFGG